MTELSFDVALKRGLGRAILFLRERGDGAAHREAILDACRNNLAFDSQYESARGFYLADVLEASGDLAWHLPRLSEALRIPDFYFQQLAYICAHLTKRGFADFQKDLYDAWNVRFAAGSEDGESHTDGAEGWRYVARRLLEFPLSEDEDWLTTHFFGELRGAVGPKVARHTGDSEQALRKEIGRLLREQRKIRKTYREKPPRRYFSEAEVRAMLESDEHPSALGGIGRRLSDEVFVALAETPPAPDASSDKIRRWIRLFWKRAFPLDPAPLLALTAHENLLVVRQTFRALEMVTHPSVRAFAEDFAVSDSPLRPKVGDLLATNPGPDDVSLLRHVWDSLDGDEAVHDFGFALKSYFDAHPDAPLTELLIASYETNPCAGCRGSFARRLVEAKRAPDWLLDEIRWDCETDTRALV